MSANILEQLQDSLKLAENQYSKLVLLVGDTSPEKTEILEEVAGELKTPIINASLTISSAMLGLTTRQRRLNLPSILGYILDQQKSLAILDNLEILFDTSLQSDPLRLLQGVSRNRVILASWSGQINEGELTYAVKGHPEYRSYSSTGILAVEMN